MPKRPPAINRPPAENVHRVRMHSERRGLRPEKAYEHQYPEQFYRNFRTTPLRFEKKLHENIFEQYNIGNENLPAHKHESEIIEQIEGNKVSVLSGATGSGKTTQLPQMALRAGYDRVVVLQPRRINADTVGDRVEEEIRTKMGDAYPKNLVGVAHSERNTVQPDSKIQFMTADTFSNMLPRMSEEWVDDKVLIMADETHENGVPTEFACALGLQSVEKNDTWRMVYASATPEESLISKEALVGVNGREVPDVHIEGRPQNIEYSEDPSNDIIGTYNNEARDSKKALIFVEGIPSAKNARAHLLRSMSKKDAERTRIYLLSSETTTREKNAIINMQLHENERSVIMSTSAGQSGITIPGVDLVVCSGITRSPEIDSEKADGLPVRLCTQAEISQQGGRTGRDTEGRAILSSPIRQRDAYARDDEVYKFTSLEEREEDMPPEVYNTNVSRNALKIAAMGGHFDQINRYMKNSLTRESVAEANDVLYSLGAIDEHDHITSIGQRMDHYSFRPEIGRAMVEFETNTAREVQIQALAIATAVENGGLADYYSGGKWRDLMRHNSEDDYMAQLDLMIGSRSYYRGRYVQEEPLREAGIAHVAAYRAHRQFDKMARVMGLGDPREIEIHPTTEDQELEIKEKFLVGMPELVFKHTSTRRRVHYYENVAGFQSPLERKIGNRSVMTKLGGHTMKYLVGFPRWYTDKYGAKQDIVEMGFPVQKEQIKRVLGHLAMRERRPEVRGDTLVNAAPSKLGDLEVGGKEVTPMVAQTQHERMVLAQAALDAGTPAVSQLRETYVVSEQEIFEALADRAEGVRSIYELDGMLWDVVSEKQTRAVEEG